MQNYYNLNQKKTRVWLRELCEYFVKRVLCLSEQHVTDRNIFTARLLNPGCTLSARLLIADTRVCITWMKEVILENLWQEYEYIREIWHSEYYVCDDSSLLGHRAMAAGK